MKTRIIRYLTISLFYFISTYAHCQSLEKFKANFIKGCLSGIKTSQLSEEFLTSACDCTFEKLKIISPTPSHFSNQSNEVVMEILKECIQVAIKQHPSGLKDQDYSEWSVMKANYMEECLKSGKFSELKTQGKYCSCQFDYLKNLCKSTRDFKKLTAKNTVNAVDKCKYNLQSK